MLKGGEGGVEVKAGMTRAAEEGEGGEESCLALIAQMVGLIPGLQLTIALNGAVHAL